MNSDSDSEEEEEEKEAEKAEAEEEEETVFARESITEKDGGGLGGTRWWYEKGCIWLV